MSRKHFGDSLYVPQHFIMAAPPLYVQTDSAYFGSVPILDHMPPLDSTMLRLISVFYLLLWYFVTADVREASTKNCDLLEPEHQQLLREQLQEDSCLREVEGVEPHEVKRAGNGHD